MIRIAGIDYEIIEYDGDIDNTLMGCEVYPKNKIFINKDLPDSRKRQTLLHEAIHIIYDNTGLEPGDSEERVVKTISAGLFQILEDNNMWRTEDV